MFKGTTKATNESTESTSKLRVL